MNLKEAREINGAVASWYLSRVVGLDIHPDPPIPSYTRERMLEAFRMVRRANKLQVVNDDASITVTSVCDDRVADMVIQVGGG